MFSLAAVVAIVAVAFPLLVYALQDRLLFHPQPLSEFRRSEIKRQFPAASEIFIERNGIRLHAWHVPGAPGRPLILYFGGNAEDVSWMLGETATRAPGLAWLLTSYRGYGASEGSPSE